VQCCPNLPAMPRTRNATSCCKKAARSLNDALVGHEIWSAIAFTVADLNVASILVWGKMAGLICDLSEATRWLDGCLARSAYGRVIGLAVVVMHLFTKIGGISNVYRNTRTRTSRLRCKGGKGIGVIWQRKGNHVPGLLSY
jgi:hypothetical protein